MRGAGTLGCIRWISLLILLIVVVTALGAYMAAPILPCGTPDPPETWRWTASRILLGTLWLLDRDDTRYAPRYSYGTFRSVRPGTTATQVVELLGEPLSKHSLPRERTGWYYSAPGSSQDYRVRALIFSADGRVVARESDCYLD